MLPAGVIVAWLSVGWFPLSFSWWFYIAAGFPCEDFDRLIAKIDAVQPIAVATLPLRERRTEAGHVRMTYQWLRRIPWGDFLNNVKTHRELHSWWGVWAGRVCREPRVALVNTSLTSSAGDSP